jgi:LAO/AO transport system kinase
MGNEIEQWAERVRAGDVRMVSRALTAIEDHAPEAEELLRRLFPQTGRAFLIGITGAPGTGKSTLVDRLAAHYRRQNLPVGVIAVDPTSPFTGGAILGDRIRMQGHATDSGIFIRSMATRGFLGGLARATADAALLLDAAGKRIILVETVGVGQDEVDIVKLADTTVVVLMPGLGDEVQAIKAGLMEIGDIFAINKADREGAERFEQQIVAMLQLSPERDAWRPPVQRTVATEDRGVAELAARIAEHRQHVEAGGGRASRRAGRWKQRLLEIVADRLMSRVVSNSAELERLADEVAARRLDPYSAAAAVIAAAGLEAGDRSRG